MEKKDNTPLLDEYLESLQEIQEAETRPFFYARLKNRLDEKKTAQPLFSLKPAYIICTLLFLLIINFWMINAQKEPAPKNDTSVSSLSSFSEDYNFTVSSY